MSIRCMYYQNRHINKLNQNPSWFIILFSHTSNRFQLLADFGRDPPKKTLTNHDRRQNKKKVFHIID